MYRSCSIFMVGYQRQGRQIGNDPAQHTHHHSFENEDPLYSTLGRTGTLLEKRAATAAVCHPNLLGKEEYAWQAQASIPASHPKPA